ncbi:MAG: gamma-glutamyltransferase [Gammaproteobacteria bacterium]|nr:gamma-glutamyltransferase [Gammaproteobacteria bacterium]
MRIKMFQLVVSTFISLSVLFSGTSSAAESKSALNQPPILGFDSIIFPQVANGGMVASQESRATQVGVEILQKGGNAVDAAIATGFALAVTLPRAGNIGGGGFMMIYDKKSQKVYALDYREMAPALAFRDMFLDESGNVDNKKARYSIYSSGVPGTVAGMVEAHKKFGKLPFKDLVEPAIRLAKELPMSYSMAQSLNAKKDYMSRDPGTKAIFVKGENDLWNLGDTIVQNDLATTLTRIANTNGKDFYHGKTADMLEKFFVENKGYIRKSDLANYKAIWRDPVSTSLGDYKIFSMPPPSSGGVHLVQLLNIIRQFPIDKAGSNTVYETHMKTEAMKFAYADRSKYLGDPDFVNVPVKLLTSESYAKTIASKISIDKVLTSDEVKPGQYLDNESPQTTHYSVMDREGNIVSNTYTLNFSYGSGITAKDTGILLNNEMDDFSAKPGSPNGYGLLGGEANAIQPFKRPLSSMTPVVALYKDEPWLATGSPGGSFIISIVMNTLLNRIVHNMNIAEATITPRIHHQWYPDKLFVEKGFPVDTANLLKQKGHNVVFSSPWGSVQSIEYKDGLFYGFADPRRPGASAEGFNK